MKKSVGGIFLTCIAVFLIAGCAHTGNVEEYPKVDPIRVDKDLAVRHLSEAVQFKTISPEEGKTFNAQPFIDMQSWMKSAFPLVNDNLKLEVINKYALLFKWQGSNPALKPVIFIAHMDVVPVEAGTEGSWKYPPFSGKSAEGFVWGRGSQDDKACVVGLLETAETLLKEGFRPDRTIYLGFGYDEETSGYGGAAMIVERLKNEGVTPEFVIDEGGAVKTDGFPDIGVNCPIAGIAVGEKGYLTLDLVVEDKGGHSSVPGQHGPAAILARAIIRLEENQFPADLKVVKPMLTPLTVKMPAYLSLILNNTWLTGPLVKSILSGDPFMDSMQRTTTAITMLEGGVAENVLPQRVSATVNFRIKPGDTMDSVIARTRKVIDDPRVKISSRPVKNDPTSISSFTSPGYKLLVRTANQVLKDDRGLVFSPYINNGGSDSRFYKKLTPDVYGFLPLRLTDDEIDSEHSSNERTPVESYIGMIQFYAQIMKEVQKQ
jgi:carboxypeptidase PM20D1